MHPKRFARWKLKIRVLKSELNRRGKPCKVRMRWRSKRSTRRDAVRTARQAAARAEKEAAFYRDCSKKAEAAKVEAMQRADNMINDAQQQADEYANEKLEKEKRKLQILRRSCVRRKCFQRRLFYRK